MNTKIIATLGPATESEEILKKMILAGLHTARLNFSHGTHKTHIHAIQLLRKLNRQMKRQVKILQDLEGYRIRIGRLEAPFVLKKGGKIKFVRAEVAGSPEAVTLDFPGSFSKLKKGTLIYIDDGKIVLRLVESGTKQAVLQVKTGGELKSHKGVNVPGFVFDFKGVTEKDEKDLKVVRDYGVDFVAQSFVRNAADVKLLRRKIQGQKIIAKIENQQALRNLDEIIEVSDSIMVARGDLGICVPIYKIPVIQKEIIRRCRRQGKPVIVATQMLDSMTDSRLPTRAEVSDVANAVIDGATHLLLSSETAVGRWPDCVVQMMKKVIRNTESYLDSLIPVL